MLYRALGHLERGFYIDIGAQHPEIDSVSKAFFDRGWQGVHVEPVPHYANSLREARPGDRVIEAAVSNRVGRTTLIVFPDTGLSTTVLDIAAGHVDAGVPAPEAGLEVPTVTLASIAEELGEREVHWLKIDVEGLEKEVLQGWDPASLRPWLVVVESTLPNSSQSNHAEWEGLLTEADYVHVYSDGLNRFYAAAERAGELAPAFALPPNVFDDVQLGKNAFMCRELSQDFHEQLVELTACYDAETKNRLGELAARYESALQQQESEIQKQQSEIQGLQLEFSRATEYLRLQRQLFQQELEQADLRYEAILKSLSWRITSPLRRALDFLSSAGRIKDPAELSADRQSARADSQQPPLSPGTRTWLAKIDVDSEGPHS